MSGPTQDYLRIESMDRHLALQVPIESVLPGGFRFGGMSHQGSLIGLPGRTQNWDAPASAFDLTPDHLALVLARCAEIDLLVIGTGTDIAVLPDATVKALREAGLGIEICPTRPAIHTYNILLSESRRVAAALMLVP
jgi:uncharacterized protein